MRQQKGQKALVYAERTEKHQQPDCRYNFRVHNPYFVTGNGVNNISILVYTMSKRVNPSINALSTLVIVLITVSLLIVNLVPIIKERRREKE